MSRIEKMDFSPKKDLSALLLIFVVVSVVFYSFILGNSTFPWDFQGPYLTHAIARMRDGTFLSPPLWMPWGGFGIPGHLSLQDGTWYLPQYLFDFFNWPYDLVGATRLQVAHVFLGGAGVYFFLRIFGASRLMALAGCLAYVFNPAFFSNGQHVDIVRGTALIPWVLIAVDRLCRGVGSWGFLLCVVVIWQFLVGSYPGLIVSAAYACAAIVFVHLLKAKQEGRNFFLLSVIIFFAAAIASGLSAVKFLPALMDAENFKNSPTAVVGLDWTLLTSIVFDFDLEFMSNDVSMRDIFIATPVLFLSLIGLVQKQKSALPYLFLAIGAIPMVGSDSVQRVVSMFPLMEVSRFHISDFRPVLSIALLMFAVSGADVLLRLDSGQSLRGIGCASIVLMALFFFGWMVGQPPEAFIWPLVSIACFLVFIFLKPNDGASVFLALIPPFALLASVALSGYGHQMRADRVWTVARSDSSEIALFGETIRDLLSQDRGQSIEYRPARYVLTALPADRAALYDGRYNFSWYAQGYSAFGYEDLRGSAIFRSLYDAARPEASKAQQQRMAWMLKRSSVSLLPELSQFDIEKTSECAATCRGVNVADEAHIHMVSFRNNGAVYEVNLDSPLAIVENEPYYPGWRARVCRDDSCSGTIRARSVAGVLRAWELPAGKYRLVTYFEPPGWRIALYISWASIAVALLVFAVLLFLSRNQCLQNLIDPPRSGGCNR